MHSQCSISSPKVISGAELRSGICAGHLISFDHCLCGAHCVHRSPVILKTNLAQKPKEEEDAPVKRNYNGTAYNEILNNCVHFL